MSLPFSRSLRSLNTDSFLVARIGLILSGAALAALLFWFFLGKVSLFETSDQLEVNEQGNLMAQFNQGTASHIQPGTEGKLSLMTGQGEQPVTIPVYVFRIDRETDRVELLIGGSIENSPASTGTIDGMVSIEIARVAPVEIVLRSGLGGAGIAAPDENE